MMTKVQFVEYTVKAYMAEKENMDVQFDKSGCSSNYSN